MRECLETWLPLTVEEGAELPVPAELTGTVAVSVRADGGFHVTYNDRPLYYHLEDQQPGDTNGHNFDDLWSVASPFDTEQ